MRDHKEASGCGSEEGHSDPSSFTEGLRERLLPFGWYEELQGGAVRFITDHSGSVPLYYAQDQGHVLAGTSPLEVADQMAYPKLDPVSAADFLMNGTVCYPYTVFEGVYAVPPGAVTEVTSEDVRSNVYYRPEEQKSNDSVEVWGEKIRDEVRKALRIGLQGKKTVKVLFSGGEDSRAIASLLPRDIECELVTFSDGYNREVKLAERAAHALGYPLRFVKRPDGFYRHSLRERTAMVGGISDIRHTHVYGQLSDALAGADAIVGGFVSDSLFKSMLLGNANTSKRRLGPERLSATVASSPVGIEDPNNCKWLKSELRVDVSERRAAHHRRIAEFRPQSAGNWHWLWPLGGQHEQFAHYLSTKNVGCLVIEPFLCPQVYALAGILPDQYRVDRKAFRAAFGRAMGTAGWLPTSSGRIPRMGGYSGHWIELATIVSRRSRDRATRAIARSMGRKPINQGAWSTDHGAFRQDLGRHLSSEQVESLRTLMSVILTDRESEMFFEPGGGAAPDLVRNRALQLGNLMGFR